MSLGRIIRRRRLELGLTQSELAGEELSKSFISQLERDRATPSLQTLNLIAGRLQTTASSLLAEAEGPSSIFAGSPWITSRRPIATLRPVALSRLPTSLNRLYHAYRTKLAAPMRPMSWPSLLSTTRSLAFSLSHA
jgi:transcriptional regulator with XRE-family HTH domain